MFLNVKLFWTKDTMRGPNSADERVLADSCTSLLIIVPVLLLVLAYCCHPFWRKIVRSICERRRRGFMSQRDNIREINVLEGDPTLVLLPSGRVVVLENRRPTPTIPDFSSLDIHELEAGRLTLNPLLGRDPTIHPLVLNASSQGSKDNLQSPVQDYLPPPSYESIFGQPVANSALGVTDPPSYTDVVSNVTFHLPESAV
uniref:Uncharacterized protein n=1 Tax=Cacopsylla melanoneura TaxID=428564 RepID=A0A8D8WF30_9HEMI